MSAECDYVSKGVPSIDIKDFLECPVCKCFVASPIYSCENGHVVCGICKPEMVNGFKCPSCKVGNLAVNGLVERMLKNKGVETICRNNDEGCTRRIKVGEMKAHLEDFCDFRSIRCTEQHPKCGGRYYAPKDLLQHWISFHGAETTKVEAFVSTKSAFPTQPSVSLNMLGSVSEYYYLSTNEYRESIMKEKSTINWRVSYFELDNQTFFIHARTFGETFHMWITLLGEESEANKYQCTCTVSSDLCTSQAKRVVVFGGILVHSLQYYDFKKVRELGYTAAIRLQNLKMLQDKRPCSHNLDWDVEIALSKV